MEGKWVAQIGLQRWSEDMEMDHDLQTQHAMARLLGSRRWETRTRTSHGGGRRRHSPMFDVFGLLRFQCRRKPKSNGPLYIQSAVLICYGKELACDRLCKYTRMLVDTCGILVLCMVIEIATLVHRLCVSGLNKTRACLGYARVGLGSCFSLFFFSV